MFLVALAAAAASPHSVTGAFGYVLGQAPPAMSASCSTSTYPTGLHTWLCPGNSYFTHIYLNARQNQVTSVKGSRAYKGLPQDQALKACLADLGRVKADMRRRYPALLDLPVKSQNPTAWLSESALAGKVPTGRSIIAMCSETLPLPHRSDDTFVNLWVTYELSTADNVRLINLDKAQGK